MNFRVFSSERDLHAGLREAIGRATASAFSPHVGIVGELEPWLRSILSRDSRALRFVGHPDSVQQEIESDESLVPARNCDLNEPLDVVIVVGPPPASVPSWLIETRSRFVVVTRREDFAEWMDERNDQLDRAWIFVLEDQWSDLVGNMGERSSGTGEDSLNGDELV